MTAAANADVPFSYKAAVVYISGWLPVSEKATREEFERAIYDYLVPACDREGVRLSREGNESSKGLEHQDRYLEKRGDKDLFDVARVHRAYASIPEIMRHCSRYKCSSDGLARRVGRIQKEDISEGDLIAAMIMRGFAARFGKRGGDATLNAKFKAEILRE
jgi:hypothetical protein